MRFLLQLHCFFFVLGWVCSSQAAAIELSENPLEMPRVGDAELRIISPTLLELTLISTKDPDPAPIRDWNFVKDGALADLPGADVFQVKAEAAEFSVSKVGFRRRPIYAPLKKRDLRIGNHLYLELTKPITEGAVVEVRTSGANLWATNRTFRATNSPLRLSPAIHVNQEGYLPAFPKKAMIGYFLGNLGEFNLDSAKGFRLVDVRSGKIAFTGTLTARPDVGYTYATLPYQNVLQADFSPFKTEGEYVLQVDGLGISYPFWIHEGIAANFARVYALGLYHQRCGSANELPFTRFVHAPCHTAPAEVPTPSFETVNAVLKNETGDFNRNPRHTARQLSNVSQSLYPFQKRGKIDVAGGHHDAGDYSKYTINAAQLIHALVVAADVFPNAGVLDNLGIPESGDGKSDLLQEAKIEADFLAKMQDSDGGFFFLVYPRDRRYEHDVLPDQGDPQVVFPKTTAATASAVAALAQCSSSPLFRKQFPEVAAKYLEQAKKGWSFLERAFAQHGPDGSYQKITHYGDEFMHDDEVAWAAVELFLATGDKKFESMVMSRFDPSSRDTKRWTWWRLFESYGCAIRSYALAEKSGRAKRASLNPRFLRACETEVIEGAKDQLRYSRENAYGASFPSESKRFRNAGWFFSSDRAFDLAVACALDYPELNDPRPQFIEAIIANLNYEAGCNPVNVSYVAGIGWKRPREMVHHYAQNDWRTLPPSGLHWGNIQEGFPFLDPYKKELGALTFPNDGHAESPTPFYDRWGDTFNTTTEFVVGNLAKSLATACFLMGKTSQANQIWTPGKQSLSIISTGDRTNRSSATLDGLLAEQGVRVLWEITAKQPTLMGDGVVARYGAPTGKYLVEAEFYWPDGRRLSAATNLIGQSR